MNIKLTEKEINIVFQLFQLTLNRLQLVNQKGTLKLMKLNIAFPRLFHQTNIYLWVMNSILSLFKFGNSFQPSEIL